MITGTRNQAAPPWDDPAAERAERLAESKLAHEREVQPEPGTIAHVVWRHGQPVWS